MAVLNPPSGSERFDFLAPLWNPSGTNTIAYAEQITELESGKKQSVINSELRGRVSNIEEALPSQVSTENPLVDKDFVNSSIATNTATFRGTYNSLEALEQVEADNNDYAFVVTTDSAGNTVYNRYKYSDIEDSSDDSSDSSPWLFEYALNNSSFTAEQWATINSGITSSDISKWNSFKNVQANWDESDESDDSFIQNKPSIPSKTSDLTNDSGFLTQHQDISNKADKSEVNALIPLILAAL